MLLFRGFYISGSNPFSAEGRSWHISCLFLIGVLTGIFQSFSILDREDVWTRVGGARNGKDFDS